MVPAEGEVGGLLARREGEALGLELGGLSLGEGEEEVGELGQGREGQVLVRRGAETAPVEEAESALRR